MGILKATPEMLLGDTPQTTAYNLSDGKQGNIQTINVMSQVARARAREPVVRRLATNILAHYKTRSQNYVDEAYAIGDYVKNNVAYVRDPTYQELLQDPLTIIDMLQQGMAHGDCDDMALLTATLLLSIGHEPYFRAVRYDSRFGHFNHIYVVVYEKNWDGPKERVVLDCILKRAPIGTEVPHMSGKEYPV